MGESLRQAGWAVFAPDFGHRASDPIPESAAQVGAYIDTVLSATRAAQIVLVGHSQGGVVGRYWMRNRGGFMKVRHMICISVPNHGTVVGGIFHPLTKVHYGEEMLRSMMNRVFGATGFEQLQGHEIIDFLADGGDLEAGVTYSCIATHLDPFIRPPVTAFLQPDEDGDTHRVHNI